LPRHHPINSIATKESRMMKINFASRTGAGLHLRGTLPRSNPHVGLTGASGTRLMAGMSREHFAT
jgi:hypothetical protein